jgi:hypothetical protein
MNVTRICPSLAMRGARGSSTFASFVRNPSRARSARHSAGTRAGGHADGERDPQWHEHDLVEYPSTGTKSGMRSIGLSAYATIAPANAFAYHDVRVSRQAK